MPSGKKAQILSLEVIVTFSFFLAAVLIFMAAWNSISEAYQRESTLRQMETAMLGISDMAVLSPGYPDDWELTTRENSSGFGFAPSRGVLSAQKLAAFQSLNSSYDAVRERMGAGASELSMEVEDDSGATLYSFGRPLDQQDTTFLSVSTVRLALLEGELVKVRVQLWRAG